ncbi:hypothetical protein PSHT_16280 [Puccinia striiformis]|uniref:Uncharacterized protein n=1 Tax=Puccinia striiformis TaxID=27350 RepID=A0A2S4UAM1_9BASI|nr:hypothetical protein PSHT_16280 [Puccinia striiformis]
MSHSTSLPMHIKASAFGRCCLPRKPPPVPAATSSSYVWLDAPLQLKAGTICVAPLRTVAQITRAYAAERAATTQSTENVDVAPSPQRLSSSLATARRRGSTNTTWTRSPPTRHSRRRQIDGNRDKSESVASATPTPVPTTRWAQRQAPWTILSNINRPAALAQVANNEADIIQRFPGEIPNYQGLMDDPCESCGSLHWRGERTLNDRRKLRASYTICCHKGKSILPIQYDEIEYPEVLKRRLVGTGSGTTPGLQ